MRVVIQERAGDAVNHVAKAEPLRIKPCGRNECFPCMPEGGKCEKNGAGNRIVCPMTGRRGECPLEALPN